MYRLCTDYIPIIYRLYTDYIPIIYRLYTDCIPIVYRLYTDYLRIPLHSDQSATLPAQTPGEAVADGNDNDTGASDWEYDRALVAQGIKIDLVCGEGMKFGQTMVLDAEPRPPDMFQGKPWPGNVGDYILVKGGKTTTGHPTSKLLLQLKTGWSDVMMWKKWNKKATYKSWPGVLSSKHEMFTKDMSTKDLMNLPEFLVDMGHVRNVEPKSKPKPVSDPPLTKKAVAAPVKTGAPPATKAVRPGKAPPRQRRHR